MTVEQGKSPSIWATARLLALALTMLILISIASAPSSAGDGGAAYPQVDFIDHGGLNRTFIFYVPEGLPDAPVPLVFVLHGGGGNPQNTMAQTTEYRWNELADRDMFIVVYPGGIDNRWNDCRSDFPGGSDADDVGFIEALIAQFSGEYDIDTNRVYATGHSNGGMMSFRLAIELSDKIAAIFSCTGPMADDSQCANPSNPVSIMYLAGTTDPLVPIEGGTVTPNVNGGHGTVLSAADTVSFWVDFLGADVTPEVTQIPDTAPDDGSTVTVYRYGNGTGGTDVLFYEVDGGGHGWPAPTQFSPLYQLLAGKKNQDIVACDEAWDFFKQHPGQNAGYTETTPPTAVTDTTHYSTTSMASGMQFTATLLAFMLVLAANVILRR